MTKISIVIPVYKPKKKYLLELFISIKEQVFQDFEIIITDDGDDKDLIFTSIPNEIIEKIKYFKNQGPHGIFGNLNNGLRNANGSYIQLFCQDDVMLPTLISNNYSSLEKNPRAKLIFTTFKFITDSGKFITFDYDYMGYIPSNLVPPDSNNYFLYFGCIPGNLSSVMVKRQLFEEIGFFKDSFQVVGDYEFWVRAAQRNEIIFSKGFHLNIRNHSHSATRIFGTLARYIELKEVHEYLIEHNNIPLSRDTIRRYLHINLFRSVMSFVIRKNISLRKSDLRLVKDIFDGEPYSLWTSLLAFIYPFPSEIKKLKQHMEVNRQ